MKKLINSTSPSPAAACSTVSLRDAKKCQCTVFSRRKDTALREEISPAALSSPEFRDARLSRSPRRVLPCTGSWPQSSNAPNCESEEDGPNWSENARNRDGHSIPAADSIHQARPVRPLLHVALLKKTIRMGHMAKERMDATGGRNLGVGHTWRAQRS